MTTIEVMRTELQCVQRDCDRNCGRCDLVLPLEEIVRAYNDAISVLERTEEMQEQLEKMRNCHNCKSWNWKHNQCKKKLKGDCFKASKWELAE